MCELQINPIRKTTYRTSSPCSRLCYAKNLNYPERFWDTIRLECASARFGSFVKDIGKIFVFEALRRFVALDPEGSTVNIDNSKPENLI
jgi:hypothetical protein